MPFRALGYPCQFRDGDDSGGGVLWNRTRRRDGVDAEVAGKRFLRQDLDVLAAPERCDRG
jgi:hypothetical protein